MPGIMASAINDRRQLSDVRMTIAMSNRIAEIVGDTTASCSNPVVVSTSPVNRDRMPPVFMSHSFGSGR